MQSPKYFRKLRRQFEKLRARDSVPHPLGASETDNGHYALWGGPETTVERKVLHRRFRSLAVRGGLGLDPTGREPFDEWLRKIAIRSPRAGVVSVSSTTHGPVERQELPAASLQVPDELSGLLLEDVNYGEILVEPTTDERYAIVAGHAKYAALDVKSEEFVSCLVRDPRLAQRDARDYGYIERLLSASVELCELLETEAMTASLASQAYLDERASQPQASTAPAVDTAPEPESIQAKSQRRDATIAPLLKKRYITRAKWADKAGVDPGVVYDYLAGTSNPRPESRKALAEVIGLPDLPE